MPIIQWNVNLLVGIQEIDRQHKHLVQSLNRAYDEFREGKEIELAFLQELIDYAARHFSCEEQWMKKTGYPKLEAHREEHAHFTGRVVEFKKELKGNGKVSVELLWFLCNWVTHHIGETDVEFGRFFDVHNISTRRDKTGPAGGDA
ncbi:Hemerythrin domain protein [Citrifermentans bremense]|uniref:Hemerythrin domain protein n=1 Tax=Citrifermentans bremense TaxID=60035 RepID=A0A6S6M5P1_9BACT|nr:bacteriohemerythrin [Citrifermentans bremense]BCG46705.1 Hemerythrin domain protein [Citrifermentans bremense]